MNRVFQIKVLRHQMVPETSEIFTSQAAKKKYIYKSITVKKLTTTLVTRRKNHLSIFLYRAQNLPSLLYLSTNLTLPTLLILAVCTTRAI